MADCLFCQIVNKKIPSKLVYENDRIIAFEDVNPQAPVHILVIPKKHISTILEIEKEDREILGEIFLVCKEIAQKRGLEKGGFRIVANCLSDAGQAVFHIHFHLLGGRRMSWPPG